MTDRTRTLALLVSVLLLAALITRNGALALLALPLLAYLGWGILMAPSRETVRLTAERFLTVRRVGQAAEVSVRVSVCNRGAATGPLTLYDHFQSAMVVTEGALRQWAALDTGETAELTYSFQSARGGFRWKSVYVTASDPFGLFEIELEPAAAGEILVQPRLRRFRPFPPRPESTLRSPGSILARLAGSGTDFWGVREYHAGDPLRRLDWRRTARHPHQFFTKELEKEEIADIGLILDARQRSDVRSGDDSLFEHALEATASLAEMFLRGGNRVSLLMPGCGLTIVRAGYGKMQLHRILCSLAKARPDQSRPDVSLGQAPLRPFGSRALIVIISPISPSDWLLFLRLRAHGNQGLLISPDPISFIESLSPQDPAGRLATRLAVVERRLELRAIAHLGVRVVDWRVHQPLGPLVRNALRTVQRRRK
jgi:uncharacterized protein (DUF58 family)